MKTLSLASMVLVLATCASVVRAEEPTKPATPAPTPAAAQTSFIEAMEKQVLYHPRKYGKETVEKFTASGGQRLSYVTPQGAQTAWLMAPTKGAAPERLWIVCGGNGSLALDFAGFCRALPLAGDAFVLVDYPGYGECAGSTSPGGIRENVKAATLAAAKTLGIEPARLPEMSCVFGHSLGCAAALLAVEELHLRAAVLCAPFTSSMEMATEVLGVPKAFPLQHRYDNRSGLAELVKQHGHAWIFHGEKDEVIPVKMSKTLAEEFKDAVTLKTLPGGMHNDVLRQAGTGLVEAIQAAREAVGKK